VLDVGTKEVVELTMGECQQVLEALSSHRFYPALSEGVGRIRGEPAPGWRFRARPPGASDSRAPSRRGCRPSAGSYHRLSWAPL
jgi:hypothetical protein